ncbi:hypothetical protein CEV31_1555 [Brucella thiophenivorans]|uniref:Uncharacterized protein n=1 Tax=Brucella thiophenivorans TaxID=571255 RepID=A0A256FZ89_9HYPH|nr:hypothetical protein CEV31_1555 [Brucella thiophenivorans]
MLKMLEMRLYSKHNLKKPRIKRGFFAFSPLKPSLVSEDA